MLPIGADMAGMATIMYSSPVFWFGLIFVPTTTLLTDFVIRTLQTTFAPSPREIVNLKDKQLSSLDDALVESNTYEM